MIDFSMRVVFLGTGTSQGVPVIGCNCKTCKSNDSKDKRLRSSVLVETKSLSLVIDAGPDFRQQMLSLKQKKLDAILLTHPHKDHIGGLDDVRAFNYLQKKAMDVYVKTDFKHLIEHEFSYAFEANSYPGVPQINLMPIAKEFSINEVKIQPIEVLHHEMSILGYRIHDFTYITDASYISEKEMRKIEGSKILVINGIRKEKHFAHFNLNQAIALIKKIGPEKGYITHISHMMGLQKTITPTLPPNIYLAYDGLELYF